jgi:mono/diheme cytochrome c family protein
VQEEKVGNRVIPVVSVLAVLVIMVILTLTRDANGSENVSLTPIEEGERIYSLICVACHDPDPTMDRIGGTFGPPIADSSLELLQLRVLGTEYPEGYAPKRDTSLMTPFPLTGTQIRALHAFLQDAAR